MFYSTHENENMSSPLFKTEGSVWRTGAQVLLEGDEEDEDWVDQSLPSSPLDRTFQDPFNAGPSKPRRAHSPSLPPLPDGNDGDLDVKLEDEVDGDESRRTLVKELESDLDDQPEDERQCRICFSGREEEDSLGRLISPCLCTGSVRVSDSKFRNPGRTELTMQYVHGTSPFLFGSYR